MGWQWDLVTAFENPLEGVGRDQAGTQGIHETVTGGGTVFWPVRRKRFRIAPLRYWGSGLVLVEIEEEFLFVRREVKFEGRVVDEFFQVLACIFQSLVSDPFDGSAYILSLGHDRGHGISLLRLNKITAADVLTGFIRKGV